MKFTTTQYNQLSFILNRKSVLSVSQDTGIPYTTLYYYSKRQRNLPERYETALIQAYHRESYSVFRETGYDVKTASSRRYWSPEKVLLNIGSELEKIDRYTFFNVMKVDPAGLTSLAQAKDSKYWQYYYEKITKSMKEHTKYKEEHPNEDLYRS